MCSPARLLLLLTSLAGATFCLLNAAGAELLCLTEGCRIYAGYGLFGISFYAFGAAWFLLVFLLALLPDRLRTARLLTAVLLLGLALDILFLGWQLLFWTCAGCLAVALLLGLAALAALPILAPGSRRILLWAGAIWLVLFFAVSLGLVKELAFRPWPIYGAPEAQVKIFFSPDCQACRGLIRKLVFDFPETADKAAFYPIAKGETDRRRLSAFLAGPPARTPKDLLLLFEPSVESPTDLPPATRLHLLANKAALIRAGVTTVPLVIAPDLPRTTAPLQIDLFPGAAPLFDSGPTEGCQAFEDTDCD